jgi:transcriptional regulator with XRE-family HTH domain
MMATDRVNLAQRVAPMSVCGPLQPHEAPTMASASLPTFGRLLRQHRLAAGLTQAALAERAGVSARGINDLERGARQTPRKDTVDRIARALQFSEGEAAALDASICRARRALAAAGNLPAYLTPLSGCEPEEVAVVHVLPREGMRLLAPPGAPGVSMRCLVFQVATDILGNAFEGACLQVAISLTCSPGTTSSS